MIGEVGGRTVSVLTDLQRFEKVLHLHLRALTEVRGSGNRQGETLDQEEHAEESSDKATRLRHFNSGEKAVVFQGMYS